MVDLIVPVADVVPSGPDVDAFIAGVRVGLGSSIVVIVLLSGVSIIRRILSV